MTHKGPVTLETERLLLRRFKREDLEQMILKTRKEFSHGPKILW